MRLTDKAKQRINKSIRSKLALALDCTEFTIIRYVNDNSDNLTKAAALKVIKKETGLKESEILTENVVSEVSAGR